MDEVDMKDFLNAAIDATVHVAQNTLARQFNRHLMQFITKLLKVYKNIPDANAARVVPQIQIQFTIVEQLIKSKPTFLIQEFYRLATPYYEKHEDVAPNRDEFIADVLPQIESLKVLQIDTFWESAPEQTKEAIWKYLQKLLSLAMQFHESENREKLGGQAMDMLKQPEFHTMMQSILNLQNSAQPETTSEEIEQAKKTSAEDDK